MTGEGRSQYTGGFGILLRLVISRIEYSLVHDEEVGIGGWQTFVIGISRGGHRQWQQSVRVPVERTKTLQLLFHAVQGFVMFIGRVCTLYIDNGVVRTKASQGVYMAVCIVTGKVAVFQPQYLPEVEPFFQIDFDFGSGKGIVAVGSQQARRSGKQGPFSIAFNGPSFEDKFRQLM